MNPLQSLLAWARTSRTNSIIAGCATLLIACCLCGGVAAALNRGGGTTTTVTTTTGQTSGHTTTPQTTATKAPKPTATTPRQAKVGDTITVDNVSTTLVSVNVIQGDEFIQPKAGNEFIVVHVKIVNHSGSEQDYNEFDFHVRTSSGNITNVEVPPSTYTANSELNSGKLTNDGSVEGDIILQAPVGDHGAKLTWQPSFFGNAGDNTWLLGL
ncbi:MAG TPA: DUF4352 domain-containing protein [Ktedonobacterales bacterium]|nr:DUF4352 domain-containing protein [Ktedonobacterales bacterium]